MGASEAADITATKETFRCPSDNTSSRTRSLNDRANCVRAEQRNADCGEHRIIGQQPFTEHRARPALLTLSAKRRKINVAARTMHCFDGGDPWHFQTLIMADTERVCHIKKKEELRMTTSGRLCVCLQLVVRLACFTNKFMQPRADSQAHRDFHAHCELHSMETAARLADLSESVPKMRSTGKYAMSRITLESSVVSELLYTTKTADGKTCSDDSIFFSQSVR